MDRAASAVQYVFLFTFAAGIVVLLAAIQSTRDERMYESAVLRTLGAGKGVVLQGIAAEFTAIGVLAGTLAAAGAGLIGYFVARELFELEYLPGPMLLVYGLVAGALVVGISGTLAARSVVKEPPGLHAKANLAGYAISASDRVPRTTPGPRWSLRWDRSRRCW